MLATILLGENPDSPLEASFFTFQLGLMVHDTQKPQCTLLDVQSLHPIFFPGTVNGSSLFSFLLKSEEQFYIFGFSVSSWHMLMFGKSAWNRQGALPNMGLEATNKLLYRDGSVCFTLKLNKENNLLLSLMAWKLWAPLPLGQTLLVLLGGEPLSKASCTMCLALCKTSNSCITNEEQKFSKLNYLPKLTYKINSQNKNWKQIW